MPIEEYYREQKAIAKFAKWTIVSKNQNLDSFPKLKQEMARKVAKYQIHKRTFNIQQKYTDCCQKYQGVIVNFFGVENINNAKQIIDEIGTQNIYYLSHKIAKLIKLIATCMKSSVYMISNAKKYNQKLDFKFLYKISQPDKNSFTFRKTKYINMRNNIHKIIEDLKDILGAELYQKYTNCVDNIDRGSIYKY